MIFPPETSAKLLIFKQMGRARLYPEARKSTRTGQGKQLDVFESMQLRKGTEGTLLVTLLKR